MAVASGRSGGSSRGGLSIDQFKRSFFDADIVLGAMDKATQKALSRFGAFTRQRARTSIRYRKATSEPGTPASGHRTMRRSKTSRKTGATRVQSVSPLREFLFFGYDRAEQSVVIGPALLNGSVRNRNMGKTIPETLEYGGQITVTEILRSGQWQQILAANRELRGRPTRERRATVRARPTMQLAFNAELPRLPGMFANSF